MIHLLHDLPQEIRDKIYRYVLVSRTQCVALTHGGSSENMRYCLHPFDSQENKTAYDEFIGLQLLRTCRQIQEECRGIFWKLNTYSLKLPWNCVENLPCYGSIRRVEMGIHYLRGYEGGEIHQWQTRRALKTLATWSREGELQKVTLNASRDGFPAEFDRIMCMGRLSGVNPEAQTLYNEYLATLSMRRGEWKPDMERKMVFHTKWPRLTLQQKRMWTKVQDAKKDNSSWIFTPWTFLKDVHSAWGGEVFVDDQLCWKDGIEITRPFTFEMEEAS